MQIVVVVLGGLAGLALRRDVQAVTGSFRPPYGIRLGWTLIAVFMLLLFGLPLAAHGGLLRGDLEDRPHELRGGAPHSRRVDCAVEGDVPHIALVCALDDRKGLGGVADGDKQEPGRVGVEGARVARARGLEHVAHPGGDLVRARALGLVDKDKRGGRKLPKRALLGPLAVAQVRRGRLDDRELWRHLGDPHPRRKPGAPRATCACARPR